MIHWNVKFQKNKKWSNFDKASWSLWNFLEQEIKGAKLDLISSSLPLLWSLNLSFRTRHSPFSYYQSIKISTLEILKRCSSITHLNKKQNIQCMHVLSSSQPKITAKYIWSYVVNFGAINTSLSILSSQQILTVLNLSNKVSVPAENT